MILQLHLVPNAPYFFKKIGSTVILVGKDSNHHEKRE
jgi:hypothetical protein